MVNQSAADVVWNQSAGSDSVRTVRNSQSLLNPSTLLPLSVLALTTNFLLQNPFDASKFACLAPLMAGICIAMVTVAEHRCMKKTGWLDEVALPPGLADSRVSQCCWCSTAVGPGAPHTHPPAPHMWPSNCCNQHLYAPGDPTGRGGRHLLLKKLVLMFKSQMMIMMMVQKPDKVLE